MTAALPGADSARPPVDWSVTAAVVSDVDETLIAHKSMRSYLAFATGRLHGLDGEDAWARVELAGAGGRDAANAAYYSLLAGCLAAEVGALGGDWFKTVDAPDLWVHPTVDLCEGARAVGIPVVLVSGSHHACLNPIAVRIGASDVVCTELEQTSEGVLTGRRLATAIGAAKAARLRSWSHRTGISMHRTLGIGDHLSDADFLTLCGQVLTVGLSADLDRHLVAAGYASAAKTPAWSLWTRTSPPDP